MPMPHWLGMRPNLSWPIGSATSPHARLICTAGTLVFTPWIADAWVPLPNAVTGGVVALTPLDGYTPDRLTPSGVEPSRRLSSRSAWMWTDVPSSRLIVGSRRSRMFALASEPLHGAPVAACTLHPSAFANGPPPNPLSGKPSLKFLNQSVR